MNDDGRPMPNERDFANVVVLPASGLSRHAQTAELLDDIGAFIKRYVVLSEEQATAVALWVPHTHAVEALGITPYLAITSAEKESGKTQLLEILAELVDKPWLTGNVSGATLARKIDAETPTLLLDESDAAFNGDKDYAEALRGVLNTGFKVSGTYSRCVGANGSNLKVHDFKTFSPKAIAGIDKLPDTVASRSIPIRLKRKAPHERIEPKRERKVAAEAEPLRERLAQWAEENDERLAALELAGLDELADRANDIWEPLLGIAYVAGEAWLGRARRAAIALSGRQAVEDESRGVRLLSDVRAVFDGRGEDRLPSAELAAALAEIEEAPWGDLRGKPLDARGLANRLKRYEIRPKTIRVDEKTPKGYEREQFEDAWTRYPPSLAATPPQPAWLSGKDAESTRNTDPPVADAKVAANPHGYADVADVAGRTPETRDGGIR